MLVASIPSIYSGLQTAGRLLNVAQPLTDEVTERIREAIELCLEVAGAPDQELEFIGIQRVTIAV